MIRKWKNNYDYDDYDADADDADGADLFEFNITWADGHLARLTDFQCQPCAEWDSGFTIMIIMRMMVVNANIEDGKFNWYGLPAS